MTEGHVHDVAFVAERAEGQGASLRLELHRHPVDAIAQAGGRRTIVEYMTKVAATAAAMHLRADHAVAVVRRCLHGPRLGIVEARPARAALEFLLRHEQRLVATRTYEG